MKYIPFFLCIVFLGLAACSTTSNLPEGEMLYTGVKKIEVVDRKKDKLSEAALSEAEAALSVPPNNSIFGSSSLRWPLPIGLWIHNSFAKYESGLGNWIYRKFGKDPKLISTVNPEVRAKAASNLLHDYGFFRGYVTTDTIPAGNHKAKVSYQIHMNEPYLIDTIIYRPFGHSIDSILTANFSGRLLRKDKLFSVIDVINERSRIRNLLHNRGYYYFNSDHVAVYGDTLHGTGKISLKIGPQRGLPDFVSQRWVIGKRDVYLRHSDRDELKDSIVYEDLVIHYDGKLHMRPATLYNNFRLLPGRSYSAFRHDLTEQRFSNLNTFQYTNLTYEPADTLVSFDSLGHPPRLNVRLDAMFDAPYDATFEMNFTSKSNSQIGPGAGITLTKKNVFKGGESLTFNLNGSYEWQTRNASEVQDKTLINSWEMGASVALSFPRLLLPGESKRERRFANSTDAKISISRMTRANYFRMISLGGDFTYQYQSSRLIKHSISPLSLTLNVIRATTGQFDSIRLANPVLALSLRDQIIPAMRYTVTFDNTSTRHRNKLWWQLGAVSSGNLTSLGYKAFGYDFDEEKKIWGTPFAQFLKFTGEVRYNLKISTYKNIVFRFLTGVICSYGNSTVAPYSEQLYIGGANSIRAFTIRSVGPGSYTPPSNDKYAYMDQTGEFKMEANAEYRFRLFGSLYGAAFLDAGNIWLLRDSEERPGGRLKLSRLGQDIALGTGLGFRYDLDFLVIRLDAGYALHAPYDTGHSGYFNVPKFKDALGLHLAIGYPF